MIIFIWYLAGQNVLQIGYVFILMFNFLGLLLFPSGIGIMKSKKWGILLSKIYAFNMLFPIVVIALLMAFQFGLRRLISDASPQIIFVFIYSGCIFIFANLKSVKNHYNRTCNE